MNNVKQSIIVNLNTPMSIGRLAAQGNHASLLAVLNEGNWNDQEFKLNTDKDSDFYRWLQGEFTKVYLRAWGKEAILSLKDLADKEGIRNAIMEEEGYITALAIGPFNSDKIDKITKNLVLL